MHFENLKNNTSYFVPVFIEKVLLMTKKQLNHLKKDFIKFVENG